MSDVTITSLTNKKVTIANCADTDTIGSLKQRFQDMEGIPPVQQTWHFPVPKGTKGAKPAQWLKSWFTFHTQLEPDLQAAMMANPLLEPLDKTTLSEVKALQDSLALGAFIILQLRPPSKILSVRVEACNWETMTIEADVSTMTCAELHVAIREKLASSPPGTPAGGKEAALAMTDYVLGVKGKRLAEHDSALLEDCDVKSEAMLELCQRLEWYPASESSLGAEELEKLESRLYSEIIRAVNGHKSELRSKRKDSSAMGCCTVQ